MADPSVPQMLPAQPTPTSSTPRTAPIATVSLVLAILSFFCGAFLTAIPAIVCGHVAWSAIKKSGGALHGKGIATAGLILGYVAIPIALLQVWFLLGMIHGERDRFRFFGENAKSKQAGHAPGRLQGQRNVFDRNRRREICGRKCHVGKTSSADAGSDVAENAEFVSDRNCFVDDRRPSRFAR